MRYWTRLYIIAELVSVCFVPEAEVNLGNLNGSYRESRLTNFIAPDWQITQLGLSAIAQQWISFKMLCESSITELHDQSI